MFWILGIAMLCHLAAYAMTGLPIFYRFHRKADSRVWKPSAGIPLGATLGAVMLCVLFGILGAGWESSFRQPTFYLMGAGYGVATAIAALRQRPQPI